MKKLLSWLLGGALSFLPLSFLHAATAKPVQLIVLASSATMGAFQALSADYEKRTGVRLVAELAPSAGSAPHTIPNRMARQEPADVVLLTRQSLDRLIKDGHADADSRVELGKAFIALAVPQGAPKPDISTLESFRQTLIDAPSIAYSDSSSGLYVSRVLFNQLHLTERLQDKSRMVSDEPVGAVLARGEAQVGFQQLSELKQADGIQIVGLIPDQVQQMTLYCGAVASRSAHPIDAKALLDYLASSEAAAALRNSGLEPMVR
ncbi:substrate-binding domain-containing protein [Pseudomonas sp. 21LCFQ010]|uniref:substrate-binding domain-containing protein n=1 Tax=Pseudomonas sp. 21LCFQ010 TaxID=2957506 RepID=UPI002096E59B|nr:substrate-binding domain-containing protein [Pseudomonas sp. 21LCFQ010]MCO8164258.1 substrate-binding domain-containing protein [Pseudomonas sp. 21LCFQ010]